MGGPVSTTGQLLLLIKPTISHTAICEKKIISSMYHAITELISICINISGYFFFGKLLQLTLYLPPQVCTCTTIHYIYYLNLHLMCHTETIIWFSHLYFALLCWEWAELSGYSSWMSWGFRIYRMNFREFHHFHRLCWRKTRYLGSETVVSAVR